MSMQYETDWCSPPGATIQDILNERKVELQAFAAALGQSQAAVERLISGDIEINHDLAILLADIIGASPRFWMQRETDYRADRMRLNNPSAGMKRKWLSSFPIAEMIKFGWLPPAQSVDEKFQNCLKFFGVVSITEWDTAYSSASAGIAFRSTETFEQDYAATLSWLRYGELRAKKIKCRKWNKEKFVSSLQEIRKLVRIKDPKIFLPKIQSILSECGVAFVVARAPSGCRASGATRFLSPSKALMILSFRHRSDDHFWFTFFHEAGHLVLHDNSHIFLEGSNLRPDKEEAEANQFSQEMLVPKASAQQLGVVPLNYKDIIRLATQIGISPGIVVGQLQFLKITDNKRLNFLKRRYNWEDIDSVSL